MSEEFEQFLEQMKDKMKCKLEGMTREQLVKRLDDLEYTVCPFKEVFYPDDPRNGNFTIMYSDPLLEIYLIEERLKNERIDPFS